MNIYSIRSRLSLTFFVAILITAVVLFASFYYAAMQILKGQTDREITSHAQAIIQLVRNQSAGVHMTFPQDQISREFAQMPGMLVAVSDAGGRQLTTSQPVNPGEEILADTLEKSANIIKPTFVDRTIGTISMRMGIFPVTKDGSVISLVLVAHPVDVITRSLNSLIGILIIITLAVGIPASLAGFLIAKSSLAPLTRLTQKLQAVESHNLNLQLPLPQTRDEIHQLTVTFNSMLSRLDESFNRERQFIGDVAHELKTPLSTLTSRIEVALSAAGSSAGLKDVLSENLVELNRLSATVNDVLDLAWAQSGEIESRFAEVDLTRLSGEIEELLVNLSAARKIHVVSEIAPGLTVRGIRQKLFRAVYNLADNAVKFTPASGKIALSLRRDKNSALLEISNTGPGIQSADLPHVFQRYYRGKNHLTPGSGLGLSICKSIIGAHGGSLKVASIPKKITTFTVTLPILSRVEGSS